MSVLAKTLVEIEVKKPSEFLIPKNEVVQVVGTLSGELIEVIYGGKSGIISNKQVFFLGQGILLYFECLP